MRKYRDRPKPSLQILTSFFASSPLLHFWAPPRKAPAFSADSRNWFLSDRPPESPTSATARSESPSIQCRQRNGRGKHGFRSPKSAIQVTPSRKDAYSPFQPSCGGGRSESRRIHGEACSQADCSLGSKLVTGETFGRLSHRKQNEFPSAVYARWKALWVS